MVTFRTQLRITCVIKSLNSHSEHAVYNTKWHLQNMFTTQKTNKQTKANTVHNELIVTCRIKLSHNQYICNAMVKM